MIFHQLSKSKLSKFLAKWYGSANFSFCVKLIINNELKVAHLQEPLCGCATSKSLFIINCKQKETFAEPYHLATNFENSGQTFDRWSGHFSGIRTESWELHFDEVPPFRSVRTKRNVSRLHMALVQLLVSGGGDWIQGYVRELTLQKFAPFLVSDHNWRDNSAVNW